MTTSAPCRIYLVESTVLPGANCRELFHQIEQHLSDFHPWKLDITWDTV